MWLRFTQVLCFENQPKFRLNVRLTEGALCFAGLTTEGLYRVSGNKTDQDNIQKQFDQGKTCCAINRF